MKVRFPSILTLVPLFILMLIELALKSPSLLNRAFVKGLIASAVVRAATRNTDRDMIHYAYKVVATKKSSVPRKRTKIIISVCTYHLTDIMCVYASYQPLCRKSK